MIQTIFLSTAIAFSVPLAKVEYVSPNTFVHVTEEGILVNCEAYQELQGWEWEKTNCLEEIEIATGKCRKQKTLWRKLIGICDDGAVRWSDKK